MTALVLASGRAIAAMATYCNEHGLESGRPYFSLDGERSLTATEWDSMRHKWNHVHGITNVWSRPPLHDSERMKGSMRRSAPRVKPERVRPTSIKPLELMEALFMPQVTWVTSFGSLSADLERARLLLVQWERRACVRGDRSRTLPISRLKATSCGCEHSGRKKNLLRLDRME